jgi:predicted GNAT family acetyltransferase
MGKIGRTALLFTMVNGLHSEQFMDVLDRPVWQSLTSHHAALSEGNALARRFLREVNLFASARDDSPEALAALGELLHDGEIIYVLQVPKIIIPEGLIALKQAQGVQMVAGLRALFVATDDDILTLGDSDAFEMLSLATLTQPEPFLAHTHRMGDFIGIRIDGRLVAMAGTRMRFPGYTEISGVCTHPDYRGRGLARRLSAAVSATVAARGDRPFLHAWKTNTAAITIYEALGFMHRTDVNVAELVKRRTGA